MARAVDNLLEQYETFMDDPTLFYAIFEYLPASYQYQLLLNLLEYDEYLVEGDVEEGRRQEGKIIISNMCIILVSEEGKHYILCALPQPFDI